jgi:hypothetical protein
MAITWRIPAGLNVISPMGNAIYFTIEIAGLPSSYIVSPRRSEVNTDCLGAAIGWRFDQGNLTLSKITNTTYQESAQRAAIIAVSVNASGTWNVRVVVRLNDAALIAIGTPFRTLGTTGDLAALYTKRIFRTPEAGEPFVAFLRLSDGLEPPTVFDSPTIDFTTNDTGGQSLVVAGFNLGPSAFGVGCFPGYNRNCSPTGSKPRLRFHWDSQSERCWMFSQNQIALPPNPRPIIPVFHDIRLSSTNAFAPSSREAEMLIQPGASPANTGYPAALFPLTTTQVYEVPDPAFDIKPNACTFGAVFRMPTGGSDPTIPDFAPTAPNQVRTIIGRYNGPTQTGLQWRMLWRADAAAPWSGSELYAQFGTGTSGTQVKHVLGLPQSNVCAVFRGTTPNAEWWIDGKRYTYATVTANNTNPIVGNMLIGARNTGSTASPIYFEPFRGILEQVFVYDERISDGALSLLLFESCRRAGILQRAPVDGSWKQPYSEDTATDPPTPPVAPEVRRLDRKPIGVITLMVDTNRAYELPPEEPNNILGQRSQWRSTDQSAIVSYLSERVTEVLMGSEDFDVMFNRPAGVYVDDIIASGIFGYINTFVIDGATSDSPEKVITDVQWNAMKQVWDAFDLTDHNKHGTDRSRWDALYARRGWFYTGGGMSLDDAGVTLQNARMSNRIVPPATATLYKGDILDKWATKDTRFRCFFLDSMNQDHIYARFAELAHDSSIYDNFTLIGEPINAMPAAVRSREVVPSFSMAGLPSGIWWKTPPPPPPPALPSEIPHRENGYDPDWATSNRWDRDTMAIYFGVGINDELDLTNTNTDANGPVTGEDNMRFGDIYRFCTYGLIPVAWGGNYRKVGAAWDYATGRIPVGRVPMLSPRISRVWR